MVEDTAIVIDLARTAAIDALRLIVTRSQLVDDAGSQLAILTSAIAMLAGTVHGATLDTDPRTGDASTRTLWEAVFAAARARPMMSVEMVAKRAEAR